MTPPQLLAVLGTSTTSDSTTDAVESFTSATDTAVGAVQELVDGIVGGLPAFVIGLVVLALFWVVAGLVVRTVRPRLESSRGTSVSIVLGSIIGWVVKVVGVLVFLAVAFPAVDVATLMGAGGVVALAAGFAFQDIFENLMAGLLLLMRQPFSEGDVVEVEGAVGVVQAVTVRETRIRRFDRQLMIIPNAQVYKNAIRLQTDEAAIRSSVIVGVGYDDDLQLAEDTAIAAMAGVEGVLDDPAPEALYIEFGDSSINLDLRYWTGPAQRAVRGVQGEVVKAVKAAFDEAGIDIPFPIRTLTASDDVADAMRAIASGRERAASGDGHA